MYNTIKNKKRGCFKLHGCCIVIIVSYLRNGIRCVFVWFCLFMGKQYKEQPESDFPPLSSPPASSESSSTRDSAVAISGADSRGILEEPLPSTSSEEEDPLAGESMHAWIMVMFPKKLLCMNISNQALPFRFIRERGIERLKIRGCCCCIMK